MVRLGPAFVLEGVVVGRADGAPVPGAEVELRYDRHEGLLGPVVGVHGTLSASTRTGASGTFRFASLAVPMQGLISVRAAGFADHRTSLALHRERPILLELDRPLPLRVILRGKDGTPLPGGKVAVGRDPRTLEWRDGFLQFGWVPLQDLGEGLYGAEGFAPGWYAAVGARDGYRPADAGWLGLREGGAPAVILLERSAGIDGRVIDEATGEPVAGARVRALPLLLQETLENSHPRETLAAGDALGEAAGATSGPDGAFALSTASPGDPLLLSVRAPGYGRHAFPLEKAGEPPLEIRLRPLGTVAVRGRILDEAGAPVPGALLRWEGVSGLSAGAVSAGPDGRFLVAEIPPWEIPLALAPGFHPVSLRPPAEVPGGDYGEVVLARRIEVRGRVVDGQGSPVSGVPVLVSFEPEPRDRGTAPPLLSRLVASDGAGGLAVPALPGRNIVLRTTGSGPWIGEGSVAPDAREPFTLLVERRPVTGTGRIRGRALLEDGRPIEERAFACLWSEDGEAPAPGATMAELDPEGRFLLRDVPAGRWTVSVQSSGFTGKAAAPAMDEGGTVEVAVRCAPWPVPDPSTKEGLLRVAPAGAAARALTGWATEGDRRSRAFRVKGEELEAKVRALGLHAVWLSDPVAGTAAVASGITTEDASPVPMSLGPAGRVFLRPRGDGKERWVVVQDAAGTVILSNLETSLPGVPGKGYLLVLPPGEYGLTLSLGIARREPRARPLTVRTGEEGEVTE